MACSTAWGKSWKAAVRSEVSGRQSIAFLFPGERGEPRRLQAQINFLRLRSLGFAFLHERVVIRDGSLFSARCAPHGLYGLARVVVSVHGPAVGVRVQKAFRKLGRLGNEISYRSAPPSEVLTSWSIPSLPATA